MFKYRITVFTPTYNRAFILEKLYRSLCMQSFLDFEWLIVDDGSTDETEQLIQTWKQEAQIEIRYFKIENGGKHRAINYGLHKAEGELFFTVDSDDELTLDALEKINKWFISIKNEEDICGIVANKGITESVTPNCFFDEDYLDKTWLEAYSYHENGKAVLSGERAIVFYTEFHKKYEFPEIPGEKFLTEAIVYNRIGYDGFRMRFYNDIIYIYEYKEDGLTKAGNALFLNNPQGYGLWLREKAQFQKISLKDKIKLYYTFTCDLSKLYPCKYIAKYIGAPLPVIVGLLGLHKLINKLRKCKNEYC